MTSERPGLVPVLGDARARRLGCLAANQGAVVVSGRCSGRPSGYFPRGMSALFAPGGTGLLSLKAASERWTGEGEAALFAEVEHTLRSAGHEVEEVIELTGCEDNHRLFVVRAPEA